MNQIKRIKDKLQLQTESINKILKNYLVHKRAKKLQKKNYDTEQMRKHNYKPHNPNQLHKKAFFLSNKKKRKNQFQFQIKKEENFNGTQCNG